MNTELVKYKETFYTVYNPGSFLVDDKNYFLDQLKDGTTRMGRYRSVYLNKNYNLTEYDYYVIVIFLGDETKVPICEFEGCSKPRYFNHLRATKKEPVFEIGCCKDHTRRIINKISAQKLIEEGRCPIQFALSAPITDERRENHRKAALKQVAEGKHPWQTCNRNKKLLETKENIEKLSKELGINSDDIDYSNIKLPFEDLLILDRETYKLRGDLLDTCFLYITELDGRDDLIKIGITVNIKQRATVKYHGYFYKNCRVLYTGTREDVADIEYAIKKKFISFIKLGTESFSISIKDEIIDFINSLITK